MRQFLLFVLLSGFLTSNFIQAQDNKEDADYKVTINGKDYYLIDGAVGELDDPELNIMVQKVAEKKFVSDLVQFMYPTDLAMVQFKTNDGAQVTSFLESPDTRMTIVANTSQNTISAAEFEKMVKILLDDDLCEYKIQAGTESKHSRKLADGSFIDGKKLIAKEGNFAFPYAFYSFSSGQGIVIVMEKTEYNKKDELKAFSRIWESLDFTPFSK